MFDVSLQNISYVFMCRHVHSCAAVLHIRASSDGDDNDCGCVDRKIALVIILTRAGLDLDPAALKRLRVTVPKLGLVPWLVECAVVAVMTHYLMDLPWIWGFLLGYVSHDIVYSS
jgi:NhaP-type Na+/H+ or K+/H+ antiporter